MFLFSEFWHCCYQLLSPVYVEPITSLSSRLVLRLSHSLLSFPLSPTGSASGALGQCIWSMQDGVEWLSSAPQGQQEMQTAGKEREPLPGLSLVQVGNPQLRQLV